MGIFLPILRADFKIVETYIHNNIQVCDIDFLILNGKNDELTSYEEVKNGSNTQIKCVHSTFLKVSISFYMKTSRK